MNNQNLKPFNALTESEQREIAQKGGIASAVAKRKKKLFKEAVAALLSGDVKDEDTRQRLLVEMGIDAPTKHDEILLALYDKARKGDVKAVQTLIELNDGKATQTVELQSDGKPLFVGFSSVLPDVVGIEEMVKRIDMEREKRLAELNGE